MADRKSVMRSAPRREKLERLVAESLANGVSDEMLQEQRISFAYGNAPEGSRITKDSARLAARSIRVTVD